MRILIATPLYPPEVADAASYTKELSRRLSKNNKITVLAYVHLPEELPNVLTIAIDKRQSRIARLLAFRRKLKHELARTDALILINGAAVEIPLIGLKHPRTIVCIADKPAETRSGLLEKLARKRTNAILNNTPPPKPEILPLEPEPTEALADWEHSWQTHLKDMEAVLNHGN